MGRKFVTAFVVASCVVSIAGFSHAAGAASNAIDVSRAVEAAKGMQIDGWASGPPTAGIHTAATPSVTINDTTGDVTPSSDDRADIVQAQAGVDGGGSLFKVRTVTPTNPSSWTNQQFVFWLMDSDFDGAPDLLAMVAHTTVGVQAGLFRTSDNGLICLGNAGYDGTWVQASFGTCGGVLHAFQWEAVALFGNNGDSVPAGHGGPPTAAHRNGYFMLGSDGKNYGFGGGPNFGGTAAHATAFATRHDGTGLWIVDSSGHVFTRGRAPYKGGAPHLAAGEIVSAIANTPNDAGYLMFTNRGRVFGFGNAHRFGDLTGHHLNGPIIAAVMTPTGNGYFMVGSDGGIFTFGDAHYRGSMGGRHLNARIVGIAPTPDNRGYWLVGSDGGVFAFGNAGFRGSMGGRHLNAPINGLIAYGNGYLMVASDGGVFVFANRRFLGSLGGKHISAPIIGITQFAV